MLALLQLLRAPNVFTAFADVGMGFYVAGGQELPALGLLCLLAASGCLYSAGMVLNDVFDVEIDRRERPARPLPSGRVSLGWARTLGFGLLLAGAAIGSAAGHLAHVEGALPWRSGAVAALLAACVLLYDGALKSTPLGPLAMGGCRFLNVLLGMSLAAAAAGAQEALGGYTLFQLAIAGGIGVYITGVTVFARGEAERSARSRLVAGLAIMAAGVALLGWAPRWAPAGTAFFLRNPDWVWPACLLLLTVTIVRRCIVAIAQPQPPQVQAAIKQCIFSLIVLDAAVCLLTGPPWAAVAILTLLVPTLLLGRWIYAT